MIALALMRTSNIKSDIADAATDTREIGSNPYLRVRTEGDPMTFKQFTIFASAARHLNITKAAKELRISQPSVSQQLKTLEDTYKAKFYRRIGRGIELTETGRMFLNRINPILDQLGKLNASFEDTLSGVHTEPLVVGGPHGLSALLLPSLLALFQRSHPQVQVTLLTKNMHALEQAVLDGEVEIAIISRPSSYPSLIVEPYRREKLIAFVAKNHPLAKRGMQAFCDLPCLPVLITAVKGGGSAEKVLRQMEDQGYRFNIAMRCGSPDALKIAVKRNAGVGILHADTIGPELRRGEFKAIRLPGIKLEGDSFIIYRRDKLLSSAARDFLTLLRQWRGKNRRVNHSLSH